MSLTTSIFRRVRDSLQSLGLLSEPLDIPDGTFATLPFLPKLQSLLRQELGDPSFTLPILTPLAASELIDVLSPLAIPTLTAGAELTTAQILDVLASRYLEPLCKKPTFIVNQPSIMSPLAKSFSCPETGQSVSARAELFIGGTEYVNLYEEENSPFAQAQKFLIQRNPNARTKDMSHAEILSHLSPSQRYYIRVLEMGMPPTGGVGIGVERLVMLLGGATRIGQVMPFGSLRSVIAMGT